MKHCLCVPTPILVLLLSLLLMPAELPAQTIRGVVLDDGTEAPVEAANILLIGADGDVEGGALTDEEGAFLLVASRTGRFRLRMERIGYATSTSPEIDLLPPDTVSVELRMSVEAVMLAPLEVTSDRGPLVMDTRLASWGYYDRRAEYSSLSSGVSHFLDPEYIRERNPARVTDLFRDLHSVRVAPAGYNSVKVQRPDGCGFVFYLDGVELRLDPGEDIDDYVITPNVAAIEIYARPPWPAQFAPVWSGRRERFCGSIVVWTGFVEGRGGE